MADLSRYNDSYGDDPDRQLRFFDEFFTDDADTPILDWLWYWLSGDRKQDRQADVQRYANQENMDMQLDMQKKAAAEMPSYQMQGLKDAGVTASAAAAAITGGSSVNAPSFSNGGSSTMSPPTMLNGIFDLIPSLLQQKLVNAQSRRLDSETSLDERRLGMDIKYTDHQIERDIEQLRQNAYHLGLDQRQLELSERLINSQVGLNRSQIEKNYADLDKIASEIERNLSHSQFMNAQTLHEYIKMDNTRLDSILKQAQTSESVSSMMLNTQLTYESEARTNKTDAETYGVNLTNDSLEMANFVKEQRLAISDALGFEIDAPEVTQVLESMVNGDFNACLKALSSTQNGYEGFARRTISNLNVRGQAGQRGRSSYYYQDNKSDYRYHWYPGHHR